MLDGAGEADSALSVPRERIRANLESIHRRIREVCARVARDPENVTLVAVTKSVGVDEAKTLLDLGVTHLGENRIDGARAKIEVLGSRPRWHMIGNVQRRKVRDVVDVFHRVDAVDRMSLAEALSKRCTEVGRTLPVLVEVNISGEAAKHGLAPEDVGEVVKAMRKLSGIEVAGLMTMAPVADEAESVRPVFRRLRTLAEMHKLPTISMGMTNDFEVAIEEGATEVRIGTALFN